MTDVCTFCRPLVSQYAAPVLTPSSQRAQPRRRILSPTPRRNTTNHYADEIPSPTPTRPQRARTRPRHFDSSPDLDTVYRCEKADHNPPKSRREFIDERGRMHPVCNECRESIAQRLLHNSQGELSDDESDSASSSTSSPAPSGFTHRFRLLRQSSAPPPRFPSLSLTPPSNRGEVNFALPRMWGDVVETVVSKFRDTLQEVVYSVCPTCLRFHSFSQPRQVHECGHCKNQRRFGRKSRLGGDNDMDPGEVYSLHKILLIIDSTRASRFDPIGGNVHFSYLSRNNSLYC
jgi:hypothetical protein